MYQKFIINQHGILKFGNVYQHRDLLNIGDECPFGGGLWKIDDNMNAILLYGRSFAFGIPQFEHVKHIDWESAKIVPCTIFYLPHWPSQEHLIPIYIK